MTTLHLDLTRDATRRSLLSDLRGRLDADARTALDAAVEAAGVPERHHHDLPDVLATIDGLQASDRVKDDMRAVYRILAAVSYTHLKLRQEGKEYVVQDGDVMHFKFNV